MMAGGMITTLRCPLSDVERSILARPAGGDRLGSHRTVGPPQRFLLRCLAHAGLIERSPLPVLQRRGALRHAYRTAAAGLRMIAR